jgi:hypothetical protein
MEPYLTTLAPMTMAASNLLVSYKPLPSPCLGCSLPMGGLKKGYCQEGGAPVGREVAVARAVSFGLGTEVDRGAAGEPTV